MVISLNSPDVYTIVNGKCKCHRFQIMKICSHTLAVAYTTGKLLEFCASYCMPTVDVMLASTAPKSGAKPGKKRVRVPKSRRETFERENFLDQFGMMRDEGDETKRRNNFYQVHRCICMLRLRRQPSHTEEQFICAPKGPT